MNLISRRERMIIGALSPNNERSAIRPSRKGFTENSLGLRSPACGTTIPQEKEIKMKPIPEESHRWRCVRSLPGSTSSSLRLPQMSPASPSRLRGVNLGLFYDNPFRDFQEYSKYFLTLRLIPLTAGQSWDCC